MTMVGKLMLSGLEVKTNVTVKKVRISSANIKLLRATPYELVPSPGSRRWLEFVSAILYLDYGSSVLAESTDNLVVRHRNSSGMIVSETIETTGFLDQSEDALIYAVPLINAVSSGGPPLDRSLVLHNTGNGEFTGNAAGDTVLDVRISYKVHKIHG